MYSGNKRHSILKLGHVKDMDAELSRKSATELLKKKNYGVATPHSRSRPQPEKNAVVETLQSCAEINAHKP